MALTTRLFRAIRLVRRRQLALWLYVAVVVFGSAGLTAFAVQDHYDVTGRPGADWALVAAFTILIALLERPRTDLVGQGNISLSFVGIFTAAFVAGPAVTGIAAFVGVFLARAIDREPPWYKRLLTQPCSPSAVSAPRTSSSRSRAIRPRTGLRRLRLRRCSRCSPGGR